MSNPDQQSFWPDIQYPETKGLKPSEKFQAFHEANPHVYDALKHLALKTKSKGHKRYSAATLVHVVRWHYSVKTKDASSPFKINNNYISRYSRLMMAQEPELEGFFATRELKTD